MNINFPFPFKAQQAEKDASLPGDALSIVNSILGIFSRFYMCATYVKHIGAFVYDITYDI